MLARIMHKFSTAPTRSSALPALHSVGLLNVPYSTFAGADPQKRVPLARGAAHPGRRFRRFVTRTYALSGLDGKSHQLDSPTLRSYR